MLTMMLAMAVVLPCKRATALAPAMSNTRLFLQNHSTRVALQKRHISTTAFLSVRGGNTYHSASTSTTHAPSTSSSVIQTTSYPTTHTALAQASVTDSDAASSATTSDDKNDNELENYKQALAIDLPLVDFGGLTYWKTNAVESSHDKNNTRKFRVLFILGGPGAGKGTQSALMAENYPVVHLSVGQLLRDAQNDESSPHRALIQEALVAGRIVPVAISLSLLQTAMDQASQKYGPNILFLVDGFPRNDDNLQGWCEYMADVASVWTTLVYQCPLKVLEDRILERARTSGRSDDNVASVQKRFRTFEEQTLPIIRKLEEVSSVLEIAGNQSLDDVWLATQQALNPLIRHDVLTANADLLAAIEQGDVDTYQRLCDDLWFQKAKDDQEEADTDNDDNTTSNEDEDASTSHLDPQTVMERQEGKPRPIGKIHDAEVEFVSGKHVAVSYTRTVEGEPIREKRVWVYGGVDGWRNVHFSRTPVLPC